MKPPQRLRAVHTTAFTLVELLVVIGIIALLVGILLPVLGRARERANGAKCAANMRSAAQALTLYTTAYKGWLPGPTTSGMVWPKGGELLNTTAASSDTTPIQNMDWVSPTLGMVFRWPENEVERLRMTYNVQLSCPSNSNYFSSVVDVTGYSGPVDLLSNSYSAVIQFHTFPANERPLNTSRFPPISNDMYAALNLTAPSDYVPKITRVGPPSKKVFLVEGARYYDTTSKQLSFSGYRYQRVGGNFMISGPFTAAPNTPYAFLPVQNNYNNIKLNNIAKTGAWRHDKGSMNLAFFDGHVEMRSVAESIQVELYTPPRTKITDQSATFDPSDKMNQMTN